MTFAFLRLLSGFRCVADVTKVRMCLASRGTDLLQVCPLDSHKLSFYQSHIELLDTFGILTSQISDYH